MKWDGLKNESEKSKTKRFFIGSNDTAKHY